MDDARADALRAKLQEISGVIALIRAEKNALKVLNLLRAADPTLTREQAGRLVSNAWRVKRAVDETNSRPSGPPPPKSSVPRVDIPNPPPPGPRPLIYDITVIIRSPFRRRGGRSAERRPRWVIPTDRPLTPDEILEQVKRELAETYQSRAHAEWLKQNPGTPLIEIVINSYVRF